MADTYPYMVSNNKIGPIFEKIKSAARPSKFTNEFLRTIGFTSTNDRAAIPLLKRLGFFYLMMEILQAIMTNLKTIRNINLLLLNG